MLCNHLLWSLVRKEPLTTPHSYPVNPRTIILHLQRAARNSLFKWCGRHQSTSTMSHAETSTPACFTDRANMPDPNERMMTKNLHEGSATFFRMYMHNCCLAPTFRYCVSCHSTHSYDSTESVMYYQLRRKELHISLLLRRGHDRQLSHNAATATGPWHVDGAIAASLRRDPRSTPM